MTTMTQTQPARSESLLDRLNGRLHEPALWALSLIHIFLNPRHGRLLIVNGRQRSAGEERVRGARRISSEADKSADNHGTRGDCRRKVTRIPWGRSLIRQSELSISA